MCAVWAAARQGAVERDLRSRTEVDHATLILRAACLSQHRAVCRRVRRTTHKHSPSGYPIRDRTPEAQIEALDSAFGS